MRIYGIDFTSAPSKRKPLTCAVSILEGSQLVFEKIIVWTDFEMFENWLDSPGPWVAGLDFPFGFPSEFIKIQLLPNEWEKYICYLDKFHTQAHVSDRAHYREWIQDFRETRPTGAKHPKRETDILAGSISPLMVFGVPVGMMLLEGAPRLSRASVSVVPNRKSDDNRIALETYPGAAVQTLIGKRFKYKSETKPTHYEEEYRSAILKAATGKPGKFHYGLNIILPSDVHQQCQKDTAGDHLDAVLCAFQAAWAFSLKDKNWGIPARANPSEGWIIDPRLLDLYYSIEP